MPGANHHTAMKLLTTAPPPVPSGQAPGCGLHGRRGEREMLDQLVADVRAGQSRVLVLRGEPGSGKTALLDYLAQGAAGCRVARVTGVEPEMEMAFAGLHQLCAPFLDRLGHLPDPQRDALRIAFNMQGGNVPDRFAVGMATLSLLSDLAAGTAAGLRGGRRAVAGPGLGSGAGVRGPAPGGRARCGYLRGALACRRTRPGRATGVPAPRAGRRRRAGHCSTRCRSARWTSGYVTELLPRPGATPRRCSKCCAG